MWPCGLAEFKGRDKWYHDTQLAKRFDFRQAALLEDGELAPGNTRSELVCWGSALSFPSVTVGRVAESNRALLFPSP